MKNPRTTFGQIWYQIHKHIKQKHKTAPMVTESYLKSLGNNPSANQTFYFLISKLQMSEGFFLFLIIPAS